tara:strand:+ start:8224 stop:8409 length:186 start_codon:yes stop_codon:yes gene_type:complete
MQSSNKKVGVVPEIVGSYTLTEFKKKYGKYISPSECKEMHEKCVKIYKEFKKKSKTTKSPE